LSGGSEALEIFAVLTVLKRMVKKPWAHHYRKSDAGSALEVEVWPQECDWELKLWSLEPVIYGRCS
jgi:hypothetical protein